MSYTLNRSRVTTIAINNGIRNIGSRINISKSSLCLGFDVEPKLKIIRSSIIIAIIFITHRLRLSNNSHLSNRAIPSIPRIRVSMLV